MYKNAKTFKPNMLMYDWHVEFVALYIFYYIKASE